jgi:hypothetical protein
MVNFHGLGKTNPLLAAILTAFIVYGWYSILQVSLLNFLFNNMLQQVLLL